MTRSGSSRFDGPVRTPENEVQELAEHESTHSLASSSVHKTMKKTHDSWDEALVAGAARQEITPPFEVGFLMSSVERRWEPFQGLRMPLFARVLALKPSTPPGQESSSRWVVLAALDLLSLAGEALGGFAEWKARICEAAGGLVLPDDLVLTCTHTHSAPETAAITALYETEGFQRWVAYLAEQVGLAIRTAVEAARPCRLEYGESSIPGFGIHRRIKTTQGILMSHPEPPAEVVISRDGATDESVNVAILRARSGELVALMINATCHPVHEMCIPFISPDYPGELSTLLEANHPGVVALFLNGAAGNINPRTVSAGPAPARRHAEALGRIVEEILAKPRESAGLELSLQRRSFELPTRMPQGQAIGETLKTAVIGLRLGEAAFVFLPGEPFVETALALREISPFEMTAVVAYAEESVGYVATDEAHEEGGYEVAFGPWSIVAPGGEPALRKQAVAMLEDLQLESQKF